MKTKLRNSRDIYEYIKEYIKDLYFSYPKTVLRTVAQVLTACIPPAFVIDFFYFTHGSISSSIFGFFNTVAAISVFFILVIDNNKGKPKYIVANTHTFITMALLVFVVLFFRLSQGAVRVKDAGIEMPLFELMSIISVPMIIAFLIASFIRPSFNKKASFWSVVNLRLTQYYWLVATGVGMMTICSSLYKNAIYSDLSIMIGFGIFVTGVIGVLILHPIKIATEEENGKDK